jgi:hypothetical protein
VEKTTKTDSPHKKMKKGKESHGGMPKQQQNRGNDNKIGSGGNNEDTEMENVEPLPQ